MDHLAGSARDLRGHHDRFLVALRTLGESLRATRDRSQILGSLLRVTADFLDCPTAVYYAEVAGSGRLRATDGISDLLSGVVAATIGELQPGEGIAGQAAERCVPVLWSEGGFPGVGSPEIGWPEVGPALDEPTAGADIALAVPVRPGNRPFGVLAYYGRRDPWPFDDDDLAALAILVQQGESAIEASFLYDETTRLSLTDGLTGLWNRRQFDLRMASELSQAVRFAEPFAVLFADIDRFKLVNDTRGHQAGDTVLVEVARRLTRVTREVDVVARYGGEEFTLLLPRTGLGGAMRLADKVCAAISGDPFILDDGPSDHDQMDLTISVGVAAYPDHGTSGKQVLGSADDALYRAKAAGGNRVEPAVIATGE